MPIKPDNFRPGDRLRAEDLQRLAERIRSTYPMRVQGRGIRRTRHGWAVDDVEPSVGGVITGVVTTQIEARSGVYPNFTYGSGFADILAWDGEGPTTVELSGVTVYNRFEDIVPASPKPVLFGITPGGLYLFINRDC